jgi:hypothetical protein
MKAKNFITGLAAITLLGLPMLASAQDYDDDIYYNPSKSKKTTTTKKTTQQSYVSQPDYAAADAYSYSTGSTRDIDEYNRRGAYAIDTTAVSADTTAVGEFGYTRRIERFHNPDVVVNSGDADLIDYYYSTDASQSDGTTINVYVLDDPFYYGAWRSPYYRFSRWGWYNPWYWDTWGPAWSFGWGLFDPWYSLSWGWGPSFSFGWGWGGLGWGHSWCGHGWGGLGWGGVAMRPTPSAGRGHMANVGSSMNSVRRASAATGISGQARPGSLSAKRFGSAAVNGASRNNSGVSSTTTGRGRFGTINNNSSNQSNTRRSNSYNNNNNSYNNYNNSNSSSTRGNGSSWGSGGRSSGGGGFGGGHSGGGNSGGGGGRGRR